MPLVKVHVLPTEKFDRMFGKYYQLLEVFNLDKLDNLVKRIG
ncbi:hypothetical protein [Brevibacillus porteri]|nr:hypothetical protein [Brevibacillus porteri]MED2813418.1 hypothetical protein [Brevibacillus porteri]MED2897985.1 hypothetical protein [Brevibacillus porteri]